MHPSTRIRHALQTISRIDDASKTSFDSTQERFDYDNGGFVTTPSKLQALM
jgi:hypothetical protein